MEEWQWCGEKEKEREREREKEKERNERGNWKGRREGKRRNWRRLREIDDWIAGLKEVVAVTYSTDILGTQTRMVTEHAKEEEEEEEEEEEGEEEADVRSVTASEE